LRFRLKHQNPLLSYLRERERERERKRERERERKRWIEGVILASGDIKQHQATDDENDYVIGV
jgi:aminoglycoside phosphotransferase